MRILQCFENIRFLPEECWANFESQWLDFIGAGLDLIVISLLLLWYEISR